MGTTRQPGAPARRSQPPEPARRLRRDAEANRRQILEAAGQLMAVRGLATPLEDIAAEAGVGIATLYRRFPTRDDLIAALFEERLATYLSDLEKAAAMPDGWDGLVWFLKEASGRQIADRALSELVEHDTGQEAIRRIRDRIRPLAQSVVRRAKATGRLRSDFTVADLFVVQQMLVAVGARTFAIEAGAWERYLTILLDGLLSSRMTPTRPAAPALTFDQVEEAHAGRPRTPGRTL